MASSPTLVHDRMLAVLRTFFVLLAAALAARGAALPGVVDPTFRARLEPSEIPADLCRTSEGMIYVLLDHLPFSKTSDSLVLRFFPDGTRDSSFRTDPAGRPMVRPYGYRSLKAGPDGRIYLEGYRDRPEPEDSVERPRDGIEGPLSLLRPDGTFDKDYGRTDIFDRILHSYHPTSQGAVWAVGRLAGRGGQSLVRLDAKGLIQTNAGAIHAPPGAWFNVNSVIERPGDRLLLVGQIQWNQLSPTIGLVQFGPDGRRDRTFQPPPEGFDRGPMANLWQATLDHEDCILVAGLFRMAGLHPTTNVARLKPDGAVDTSFQAGPMDGAVEGLWEDESARLIIAGGFSRIQNVPRTGLARLDRNGTLDTSFAPELPPGTKLNRAIDGGDSSLLVAGYHTVGFNRVPVLLRLHSGDSLPVTPTIVDQPQGTRQKVGGDHAFSPLVRMPAGSRFQWLHNGEPVPGATNAYHRFPRLRMEHSGTYQLQVSSPSGSASTRPVSVVVEPAAATPGSPDMSVDFEGGPSWIVHALRLLPDGRLLVAGEFERFGTNRTGGLVVLTPDGRLDVDATQQLKVAGRVMALVPDGDGTLVVGAFRSLGAHPTSCLGRVHADGTVDPRVQSKVRIPSTVQSAARLRDGSFLISGSISRGADPNEDFLALARLRANGDVDYEFKLEKSLEGHGYRYHTSNLGDGRVVLLGWSSGKGATGFLRFLDPDGILVPNQAGITLKPSGLIERISTVPLGPDGLLVAGDFSLHAPDGVVAKSVAEFQGLTLQNPEALGAPKYGSMLVTCGILDPEQRLIVAGLRLQRWVAGKPDPSFKASVEGTITCVAADSRGDLYVGGNFQKIGEVVRPNLARILGSDRTSPYVLGPFRTEHGLVLQFETNEGWSYEVESSSDPASGPWDNVSSFRGDGKLYNLAADADAGPHRFYRVRAAP